LPGESGTGAVMAPVSVLRTARSMPECEGGWGSVHRCVTRGTPSVRRGRRLSRMQQWMPGHEADMERTLQRADQRKIQRWLWELDQRREVRFGVSVPKAVLLGVVAWVFFIGLVAATTALVVDPPDLILFRD